MGDLGMSEEYAAVQKEMQPLAECPVCGLKPKTRTSFQGRSIYRNKRKTQYCECGWSKIIPTEWEAMVQLGMIDED